MRVIGLEPIRGRPRGILSPLCLPIPPHSHVIRYLVFLEAAPRFELGIKVLQTSALPLGYAAIIWSGKRDSNSRPSPWQGDALPLSYFRKWCLRAESNRRHVDFQSTALPTELPRHLATPMGFEPTLSAVTGRHVNRYTTGPTTVTIISNNQLSVKRSLKLNSTP